MIDVDPLSTREPSKPAPSRGGEVDAREQRGERRAVDLHPGARALDGRMAAAFTEIFKQLGFLYVTLDLEGYRQGSLNAALAKA